MTEDAPKPEYARFDSEAGFQQAVDTLLGQAGRELRIFDSDLAALRPNLPERVARIERFLQASRTRRLYIVVHETEHIAHRSPRLMGLLARYSHMIQVNRTHEEIRKVQDAFLVLDSRHYLRRPVAVSYRGAIGLNDEAEGLLMRARFMEIWAASFPGVSSTTVGL